MKNNQNDPAEPASNRLAAFLRDCLLGLIVLAMIGWLLYFGVKAIVTGHLDLGHSIRPSRRWFRKPLDGLPAVLAGLSFVCLAAAFLSICTSHPRISGLMPARGRNVYWWFFAGWAVLYIAAKFLSKS